MADFESLKITDFDHLEFAVGNIEQATGLYLQMGFQKAAVREIRERQLQSYLMVQNNACIILSQSTLRTDPVMQFVETHGDGLFNIAFRCEDAVSALEIAVNRGAEVTEGPKLVKRDVGAVQHASIKAFGKIRHTFISRQGHLFAEGFDIAVKVSHRGCGLERFDHITSHVEK